jgi:hypothetical protein
MHTMSDPFSSFLQEIQQQLSDPSSPMYLPLLILEQTPPYDPYQAGTWDFGAIAPPTGTTLANNICQPIGMNQNPPAIWIPTPAGNNPPNPVPSLLLTNVLVVGLANAKLTSLVSNPPGSFNLMATINFGQLSGQVQGYTLQPNIVVSGNFTLSQSCCPITPPNNTACSGSSLQEVGTGTFTVTLSGSSGTTALGVSFQGSYPELLVTVQSMTFAQGTMTTSVAIDNIPNQAIWSQQAGVAFNTPGTQQLIINQINQTLASPSSQASLGTVLQNAMNQYLKQQNLYPYGPLPS